MILLKDFHNLFGQWLQEKINLKQRIPCYLYHENPLLADAAGSNDQRIILQQIQSKDDFSNLNQSNNENSSHRTIIWWSGNNLTDEDILYLLNAGANSIITAKQELPEILHAIEEVMIRGIYYNEIVNKALHQLCVRNKILSSRGSTNRFNLNQREKKIIELRYSGKTSKEIAEVLFLSKKTIDKIFGDMYRRFECNNFFELLKVCEYKPNQQSTLYVGS